MNMEHKVAVKMNTVHILLVCVWICLNNKIHISQGTPFKLYLKQVQFNSSVKEDSKILP